MPRNGGSHHWPCPIAALGDYPTGGLTAVPGVGAITAVAFVAAIDYPARFH
jgi:transposase